jgi:glycosyltransferase involved in cell wall biosynthesis
VTYATQSVVVGSDLDCARVDSSESPLRIGINLLFLIPGGVGGTEIFARNVLLALAEFDHVNQYFVFRNNETEPGIVPDQSNFIDCPQRVHATFRPARIIYEQTLLVVAIMRRKLDVVLNAGYTAPLLCTVPMVTVSYDLHYKVHPENFRAIDLLFWRILLPASAHRSTRLVTMSEAARRQLEEHYGWYDRPIDVVPHGIEARFEAIARARGANPARERFILAVSTLGPNKNYDCLLRAYKRFHRNRPDIRLVIVGIKGSQSDALVALREELGLNDAVTFTGWIPREDLYQLYEDALAFVYPSKFEGFGIPVLEAIAAGIPTACSAIPSLDEIAARCARFFDPNDVEDLELALREITAPTASQGATIAIGRERAQAFGWKHSAVKLLNSLRSAASTTRSRTGPSLERHSL